jgi:SAM-dependent methyltransferase
MKNSLGTDLTTLDFYAREAPDYVASGPGGVSRHLHHFLSLLPKGGKILDLGCGCGLDSEEILRLGFDAVPTDGAPEMAQKAEERLCMPVRVMRFDQLDIDCEFDAVWAHASLLHVPVNSLPCILLLVFKALKPGGYHFANYKSGGQAGRDQFQRYFNYVSVAQAREAYDQSAAWDILETEEYSGGGYNGGQGPWVAVTAKKP